MKNKRITAALLLLLIAVQSVVYVAVAHKKQYLHMDEAYSFGLSQYHGVEIQDNHDFYGNWHSGDYYRDYLVVDEDELNDISAVYNNQKNDVHPPLYYFFLRFFMEFSVGEFSMMTGIILNIIIYAFVTLILYFIVKRIFSAQSYAGIKAFVVTCLSSFTLCTLSNVIYIRMYALLTLFVLLILMLHIKEYESGRPRLYISVLYAAVSCLGVLTHYYFLFFLLPLYILFSVRYLRKKDIKNAALRTVPFAVAAIGVIYIFPHCIDHMFFGYRGQGVVSKLFDMSGVSHSLSQFLKHINKYVFNATLAIIVALIAIFSVGALIKYFVCKNKCTKENTDNANVDNAIGDDANEGKKSGRAYYFGLINTIWIPTAAYFLIVAIASPYTELRYMYPICPLIFALLLAALYFSARALTGKIGAVAVVCAVVCAMVIMPNYKGYEPQVMYSERQYAVDYIKEHKDVPTIYAFITENDRFLDDIYLFTLMENSYITRDWDINSENMTNVFEGIDTSKGVIVFINVPQNDEYILEVIRSTLDLKNIEHVEGLNSANIYYIGN